MTDENDGELAKRKPEGERSAGASRRTPPPRRSGRRLALIVALLLGVRSYRSMILEEQVSHAKTH